jgi:hypothetical protein
VATVNNGTTYNITFYFMENNDKATVGTRIFTAFAGCYPDGTPVGAVPMPAIGCQKLAANIDIFAAVGYRKVYTRTLNVRATTRNLVAYLQPGSTAAAAGGVGMPNLRGEGHRSSVLVLKTMCTASRELQA